MKSRQLIPILLVVYSVASLWLFVYIFPSFFVKPDDPMRVDNSLQRLCAARDQGHITKAVVWCARQKIARLCIAAAGSLALLVVAAGTSRIETLLAACLIVLWFSLLSFFFAFVGLMQMITVL